MKYIEYTLKLDENTDARQEIISAILGDIGFESFMEDQTFFKAYIQEQLHDADQTKEQLDALAFVEGFSYQLIKDQNWNKNWEESYEPVEINEDCIVRAPFHAKTEGIKYDLLIEPRMSFGTAHHETTFLMLRQILKEDWSEKNVLDMGCGTAVLGILAIKMGASSLLAVDNDEWAYNNSLDNLKANDIANQAAKLGGAECLPKEEIFDAVFANINRNILLADMKHYAACMKKGAFILFSGFYTHDEQAIENEARKHKLVFNKKESKNDWLMMRFIKS